MSRRYRCDTDACVLPAARPFVSLVAKTAIKLDIRARLWEHEARAKRCMRSGPTPGLTYVKRARISLRLACGALKLWAGRVALRPCPSFSETAYGGAKVLVHIPVRDRIVLWNN